MTHDSQESGIRVLDEFGDQIDGLAPDADRHVARRLFIRRAGFACAVLLLAALLSATPQGRAVADELGELVGIGEPTSVQESDLRDPRLNEQQDRVGPAIVVGKGTMPGGTPFEIVGWGAIDKNTLPLPVDPDDARPVSPPPGDGPQVDPAEVETGQETLVSCLGVVYPSVGRQETGKVCRNETDDQTIHVFGTGVSDEYSEGLDIGEMVGTTSSSVEEVQVTYEDEDGQRVPADVTFGKLEGEALETTGAPFPFGFFVAHVPVEQTGEFDDDGPLPHSATLESVEVVALDDSGAVIGDDHAGASYTRAIARSEQAAEEREAMEPCFEALESNAPRAEVLEACRRP